MKTVTLNGPEKFLELPSGRTIVRGETVEVTNEDGDVLADGPHDVTVEDVPEKD